jgi:hypothetical protein
LELKLRAKGGRTLIQDRNRRTKGNEVHLSMSIGRGLPALVKPPDYLGR